MFNHKALLGHSSMLLADSLFGLLSPISKIVMLGGIISPLILTELRISGAMILFWLASFCVKHEHVPHGDLLRYFFAALFAVVFNQGTFIFGVGLTTPGDASILTTSMPLWAMLFAALLLKDPITGRKVLGIAAGAIGAIILILNSQSLQTASGVHGSIFGDILVTCAQISFAFYVVRFKDLIIKYSLVTSMKWLFTFAFICTMPFLSTSLARVPWAELDYQTWAGIAFVILGGTFFPYIGVAIGQRSLKPTVVAMYNYVQPVVACLAAIYLGLDAFTWVKAGAVVLIFCGVYLVTHSRTKEEIEAYHAAQAATAAAAADPAERVKK